MATCHSHIDHLTAMLTHAARKERIPRARVHILLDGRDVGETSALDYVCPFEGFLRDLNLGADVDYRIASGGGRMAITMDRYEANWEMVAEGWRTHVAGEGASLLQLGRPLKPIARNIRGSSIRTCPPSSSPTTPGRWAGLSMAMP